MTIDEMRDELNAAGHRCRCSLDGVYVIEFDECLEISHRDQEKVIARAYAHIQREKKFAAMESLLEDMVEKHLYTDTDDRCNPSKGLLTWIGRAKSLLGK